MEVLRNTSPSPRLQSGTPAGHYVAEVVVGVGKIYRIRTCDFDRVYYFRQSFNSITDEFNYKYFNMILWLPELGELMIIKWWAIQVYFHSYLRESTGLAVPVLKAWKETVSTANTRDKSADRIKIQRPMDVL